MFETLISNIRRAQAELDFELSRCEDPYRLEQLMRVYNIKVAMFREEAMNMVNELERRDDES